MSLPAQGLPAFVLALACLLLELPAEVAGARLLAQQQGESPDPFANVVSPESTNKYQEIQGSLNQTLLVFRADMVVRLSGARFVPLTLEDQKVVIQAAHDVIFPSDAFVQIKTYKECYPDPSVPEGMRLSQPALEFSFASFYVPNKTIMGKSLMHVWETKSSAFVYTFLQWSIRAMAIGNWTGVVYPQLLAVTSNLVNFTAGEYTLHPIVVLEATLSVTLTNAAADVRGLLSEQVSVVAQTLEAAILTRIGTLVEPVNYAQRDRTGAPIPTSAAGAAAHPVQLEVTLFMCRDNATVPSPECEQQVLAAVLAQVLQSEQVQQQWQAAGIQSVQVVGISQRQPPSPPSNSTVVETSQLWVPWHLDRIDQRSLPLDGQFTATADGTGVNVYIISSGIMAGHEEFGHLDGTPGTRVVAGFGYNGNNTLEDCSDSLAWYGFGTYKASLCCGLKLGAAKNATIYSVRFREFCLSDSVIWSEGTLPAALDTVLSTFIKPAVVLIDTWWSPRRPTPKNVTDIGLGITMRLDAFLREGIPVVAAAGPGLFIPACENVISRHPAVISVASSDTLDQSTTDGPWNSSCIDVWAPGGGLGTGQIGASPSGNSSYDRVIPRAFGSAAIVAGVAAQYLQLHPTASAAEVRTALVEMSTQHIITGAGPGSPDANLLFTNLTKPANTEPVEQPEPPVGGSGLASGALAAIIVVSSLVVIGAIVAGHAFMARKRRLGRVGSKSLQGRDGPGWEVSFDEIEVCRRPDGSEWLLGEGRYGKVYKALKSGVQVVAVKKLHNVNEELQRLFIKEIDMMRYVSRDAGICQFYGACRKDNDMMLIVEYMEDGDLYEALSNDKSGQLQWCKRGKDVMLDIVRGTHFLHMNHVVHRDIKSKNILLGRGGRAKLADVGLAQLFSEQQSTESGFVGTLAWAAPEVLLGEECSEKSDIYSLGVVLWEIATREKPQRGRIRDPQVPLECPPGVADAIRVCMQPDPALRPSARELYALLIACPPMGNYVPHPIEGSEPDGTGTGTSNTSNTCRSPSGEASSREGTTPMPLGSDWHGKSGSNELGPRPPSSEIALVNIAFESIEFCKDAEGKNEMLGSGSFGAVYKVLLDGVQPLAAKEIQLGDAPEVEMDFIQEAGLLWKLRHQNIVGLTGMCISEGKGYLLMELMDGGCLFSLLKAVNKHTKERVFGWYNRGKKVALDVARGMHYLHSLRITHFDLKSANVLLTKELNAKLSDVGLARVMSCTHHSLGDNRTLIGTLAYMAPELLAGSQCTQSVDVYSFGVLLWELCTGTHPIRSRALELQVPQDCPQEVADLYTECTAADPAARPTAREVVMRLIALNAV